MRAITFGLVAMSMLIGCSDGRSSSEPLGRTQQALSTGLVISAIYGGPGSGPYKNDWVEIFNRGPTAISLTGMTIQYSRSDYKTWDVGVNKIPLTGSIPAGGYYLVSLSSNSTGTTDLPTADLTGAIVVATNAALFAIVSDSTTLDCGPPPPVDGGKDPDAAAMSTACTSTSIIDFVGYGKAGASPAPAPYYEGTSAAVTGASTSVIRRKGAGCVETDDNGNDFELVAITGGPAPRNSASPLNDCGRSDGGVDADVDADLDTGVVVVDSGTDTGVDTGTVVVDSGTDTGAADAADTGATDTATTADADEDTGTPVTDSGTPVTDSGTTPADTAIDQDTGTTPTDEPLEDEGCGCRMPGSDHGSRNTATAFGIIALGAIAARVRRRR